MPISYLCKHFNNRPFTCRKIVHPNQEKIKSLFLRESSLRLLLLHHHDLFHFGVLFLHGDIHPGGITNTIESGIRLYFQLTRVNITFYHAPGFHVQFIRRTNISLQQTIQHRGVTVHISLDFSLWTNHNFPFANNISL